MSQIVYANSSSIYTSGVGINTHFVDNWKRRGFEKISFDQYVKDVGAERHEIAEEYLDIKLPRRATEKSSGYDFYSACYFQLAPGETIKIPTGIKVFMQDNEVLNIYIRSSLGFKYDVVLSNGTGIIDSDYYNNPDNEGHIWIKLINHGEKTLEINKGEAFAQGIFTTYLITDDDKPIKEERTGGIGSTNTI